MKGLLGGLAGVAATAAVVAGFVFVAVESDAPSAPNLIAESADLAETAGTSRVSMTFEAEFPEGSGEESGSFGGEGVMDLDGETAEMTLDFSTIAGPGDPADARMRMRAIGTVLYIGPPEGVDSGFPTEWISMDLAELADGEAGSLFGDESLAVEDPTKTLDFLRGAGDEVEEVGAEVVRDVETTHYRAELDMLAALDEVAPSERATMGHTIAEFEALTGGTTFPVEVWIDADGLPRRFRFFLDLPEGDADMPAGARFTMTMEMWDYGIEVDVTPPPADQVTDVTPFIADGSG